MYGERKLVIGATCIKVQICQSLLGERGVEPGGQDGGRVGVGPAELLHPPGPLLHTGGRAQRGPGHTLPRIHSRGQLLRH